MGTEQLPGCCGELEDDSGGVGSNRETSLSAILGLGHHSPLFAAAGLANGSTYDELLSSALSKLLQGTKAPKAERPPPRVGSRERHDCAADPDAPAELLCLHVGGWLHSPVLGVVEELYALCSVYVQSSLRACAWCRARPPPTGPHGHPPPPHSLIPLTPHTTSHTHHHQLQRMVTDLCTHFWRAEVRALVEMVEEEEGGKGVDGASCGGWGWDTCARGLAVVMGVLSVHCAVCEWVESVLCEVAPGIGKEGEKLDTSAWLCNDKVAPVVGSLIEQLPDLLYSEYIKWLEADLKGDEHQALKLVGRVISTSLSGTLSSVACDNGQVLESCWFLCSVCRVLVMFVKMGGYGSEEFCAAGVRLGSLYHHHLSKIIVKTNLCLKNWYLVLNSALLLHKTLLTFRPLALNSLIASDLAAALQLVSGFCDSTREKIVDRHSSLLTTVLLHDPASNHWDNPRPFFEGERCSFTVQMWTYHLNGLRHDLWATCPGRVAVKILESVVSRTLVFLTERYTSVCPSAGRTNLFRADILAILISTASHLPHLTYHPPSSSSSSSSSSFPSSLGGTTTVTHTFKTIQLCCSMLLAALVMVGGPIDVLSRSLCVRPADSRAAFERQVAGFSDWRDWVDFSHFGVLPPSQVPPLSELVARLCALPYPEWDLLLKVLLGDGGKLAVALCKSAGMEQRCGVPVVHHLATVLALCLHQPLALSLLFTSLQANVAVHRISTEKNTAEVVISSGCSSTCVSWLVDLLGSLLESDLWKPIVRFLFLPALPSPEGEGCVLKVLEELVEGIEASLSVLQPPLLLLLTRLSDSIESSESDFGFRLMKLLGLLLVDLMSVPKVLNQHLSRDAQLKMQSYCALIRDFTTGAVWVPGASLLDAPLLQAVTIHSQALHQRLHKFGSLVEHTSHGHLVVEQHGNSSCCDAEQEEVAHLIMEESKAQGSMEYLFKLVRRNEKAVLEMLSNSTAHMELVMLTDKENKVTFDPVVAMGTLGKGCYDHKWLMTAQLDWKDLTSKVLASAPVEKDDLIRLFLNRTELQEEAKLTEHENEVIQMCLSALHLNPDDAIL